MRTLAKLFLSCLLLMPAAVSAVSKADFTEIHLQQLGNQQYEVSTKIDLRLSDELRNALERGVPLYFTLELRVYKPRKYWFDALELEQSYTWRVQYNALLRQWRVHTSEESVQEFSLDASLAHISGLANWPIPGLELLDVTQQYEGVMRLKLDTSMLARPFQITAVNSSAWSLSSPWKKFAIQLSAVKPTS